MFSRKMYFDIRRIALNFKPISLLIRFVIKQLGQMNLIAHLNPNLLSPYAMFQLSGGDSRVVNDIALQNSNNILILGGYTGESVKRFLKHPHNKIFVLEPVSEYYESLIGTYSSFADIEILNIGVSNINKSETLYINGQTTSSFDLTGKPETVTLVDISEFLSQIGNVDVIEMNIEGSEYEVLEKLLAQNLAPSVRTFLIQFHKNVIDFEVRRASIRKSLVKSHYEVFNYDYVWERWDRLN